MAESFDGIKGNQHVVELMLLKPMEPLFIPKGPNKVVFDIPSTYVAPWFKNCILSEHAVEGNVHVKINDLNPHPAYTFEFARGMERRQQFSDFIPEHQILVTQMTEVFKKAENFGDFLSLAAYARDNLNVNLFQRAFSTAVLHRPDMRGIQIPSTSSTDPYKFFSGDVMSQALEQANVMGSSMIPPDAAKATSSNQDPEHRVAYFREDLGVNSHHWKWHLVYPREGPMEIVAKNRRGELFYYMHQQILARYNADRLANQLGKVRRFNDFKEPILEAYFPKLGDRVSMRNYPARHANTVLRDIDRKAESFTFDIAKLDIWRSRIYEAIDTKSVKLKDGSFRALDTETGIDVLGNLLESSILSLNKDYYGDLHSSGHIACAVIHDPDNSHLEPFSVMGDVATACRDPFFYRWHAMIDDLFQSYKKTLPAYNDSELAFRDITILKVDIIEENGKFEKESVCTPKVAANPGTLNLNTFWMKDYIDVANGLDFQAKNKPVHLGVTHLQHKKFDYSIRYENKGQARYGTVRIFLAPKFDEDGKEMTFNQQRTSFIEMDKFVRWFERGTKTLKRCSCNSSVTVLKEDTFKTFKATPKLGDVLTKKQESEYFCGCGWPNHMLVPKGTCEGMDFVLFVMISDFQLDNVHESTYVPNCGAPSYCGIRDKLYPDKRTMGFPFDRDVDEGSKKDVKKTTKNIADMYSNMSLSPIIIRFTNTTVGEKSMEDEITRRRGCNAPPSGPNIEKPAPVRVYNPCNSLTGVQYFTNPLTGAGYFADPSASIASPCMNNPRTA